MKHVRLRVAVLVGLLLRVAAHDFLFNVGLPANFTLKLPPSVKIGRVALLTTWFGAYPCIGCSAASKTKWCNGGLPQLVNYSVHEAAMRRDMGISVPDANFSGYIVHDYEAWTVPWGKASAVYQNASIALARSQLPAGTPESTIVAHAEREYDRAALQFLVFTIDLTRRLRPHAAGVGFYGYPAHTYWGNQTEASRLNDQLMPLWRAQTAFYPSIYLPYGTRPGCTGAGCADAALQTRWVDGGVNESLRVAALAGGHAPTLPYAWYRYHDGEPKGLQLLNATDAALEFSRPFAVGGAAVHAIILWGSERNESDARQLQRWLADRSDIFGTIGESPGAPRAAAVEAARQPVAYLADAPVRPLSFERHAAVPPYTRCGL